MARRIAVPSIFDLDDLSAMVSHHHGEMRARQKPRQIQYFYSGQFHHVPQRFHHSAAPACRKYLRSATIDLYNDPPSRMPMLARRNYLMTIA